MKHIYSVHTAACCFDMDNIGPGRKTWTQLPLRRNEKGRRLEAEEADSGQGDNGSTNSHLDWLETPSQQIQMNSEK